MLFFATHLYSLTAKTCDSRPGTSQEEESRTRRSTRIAAQAAREKMSIVEEISSK